MAELITYNDVQAFRPVHEDSEPFVNGVLIPAAGRWFEGRIGRPLASATVTERLSGQGTSQLVVSRWPITAVTTVEVDGAAWSVLTSSTAEDSGEEVFLPAPTATGPRALLARNGLVWPEGQGNIRVVYVGGFVTAPEDMRQALVMVVHLLFKEGPRIGEGAIAVGQESIQQLVRNADDYHFIRDTVARYAR